MVIMREMLMAIIDSNQYLGDGVTCAEEANRFPLGFSGLAKKAKIAAGIFLSIDLENVVLLIRHPNSR
jgi:hypothetical protein